MSVFAEEPACSAPGTRSVTFSPNPEGGEKGLLVSMRDEPPAALNRQEGLRQTVLRSFCDPLPAECHALARASRREWRHLLHWLDVSGLALYFLDRLGELRLTYLLPAHVFARLQQNLHDNAERTGGMIAESVALQEEFQASTVRYAVLKGFSLAPESVPRPELRHQFDLDFLVDENGIAAAQAVLERRGYRLYAVSGKSWEFKKDEKIGISMRDFYEKSAGRAVELHLATGEAWAALGRLQERDFHGIDMPVLAPVDLFLAQAMHAYKHVCGEFSRAAHLLEFYRYVVTRRDDEAFWEEVRERGEASLETSTKLGILMLLITYVMGDFAPSSLTEWTVERLSPAIRLWVRLHGVKALFRDVPGSKLYLLLTRELETSSESSKTRLREALLPRRLPPPVVLGNEGEELWTKVQRGRMQMRYLLLRLRFHLVEGARFGWAAYQWERQIKGLPR